MSGAAGSVNGVKDALSAAEARRMALAAQGLAGARPSAPTIRHVRRELARMHVLQIDSVNVFARSHYVPLLSRLGPYDTGLLDRLVLTPSARGPEFVEYLAHEATFVPVADWPLWRFRMDAMRAKHGGEGSWFAANTDTVSWVRAELAERGPLRPAEIERDLPASRGPWWGWDDVKRALEMLWRFGEVAIAGRSGFERRYGLAEQVIPPSISPAPSPTRTRSSSSCVARRGPRGSPRRRTWRTTTGCATAAPSTPRWTGSSRRASWRRSRCEGGSAAGGPSRPGGTAMRCCRAVSTAPRS